MKFFTKRKDGGPESKVTGFFLVEIKSLFTIVLLRFDEGTREAYHSHAFSCISWVLSGGLLECFHGARKRAVHHFPSVVPVITRRSTFHKVYGQAGRSTWVLSFRGPWAQTWNEYLPAEDRTVTLTHGRKEVSP